MIQFDAISLSRTENCVCRRIPFAVEMYLIEFLLLLAFLRGAVLVDYHPPSLSSFHCDKWKDKLPVTLSQSQSPVAHALC